MSQDKSAFGMVRRLLSPLSAISPASAAPNQRPAHFHPTPSVMTASAGHRWGNEIAGDEEMTAGY